MNILVVQESDWINRNPHQQHHLMERLNLRGHKIRVIDYEIDWRDNKDDGLISPRKIFPNVKKTCYNSKIYVIRPLLVKIPIINYLFWIFSNWREINRQIKEFKPDIIIGFGLINTYIASRIAKKNQIPFLYYLIDVLYTLIPEKAFQSSGKHLKKRIIKNADLVITINKKLAESAIRLGSTKKKTIVIGAGIDRNMFNHEFTGSNVRERYNIGKNDQLLFFMGWIYEFSGLKEIAEELGRRHYDNIKLMVVGEGDAYNDLKEIQKKFKMSNQLILTGKQPYARIPEFIAAADICILPAYPDEPIMQDIVPIKLYEYMAMGKPVISTKLPGIMKEFGENNGLNYVNKPEDVLLESQKINLQKEGEKALKFMRGRDWDNITDILEEIIKKETKG